MNPPPQSKPALVSQAKAGVQSIAVLDSGFPRNDGRWILPLALSLLAMTLPTSAAPRKSAPRKPLAGAFVKSKEWKLLRTPNEVEEFIGDVYYRQGGRQIRADWARYDRALGVWEARGDVSADLRRIDGGVMEVLGERARHDERSRRGWIAGHDDADPVSFRYFAPPETAEDIPPVGPIRGQGMLRDRGTARRMEWNDASSELTLVGRVHTQGQDGELWSERAAYRDEDRTLALSGRRPVLAHSDPEWTNAIQAERLTAAYDYQRVDADGHVNGWLEFKETGKNDKKFPLP